MESRRPAGDELPKPAARRLQRPSWRDSRLVAGVLLVLLATIGGAAAMRHYDTSIEVLQASHPLVPGQQLDASDVHAVKVRIDEAGKTYLSAADPLPKGKILREVRSGELVPRSAIGEGKSVHVKALAIPVDSAQSANLVKGSVVDVWVSTPKGDSTAGEESYDAPQRVLERAVVARVPSSGGAFSVSSGGGAVHVLVPDDRIAQVLEAIHQGAKVDLVPAAGSALKGS